MGFQVQLFVMTAVLAAWSKMTGRVDTQRQV